MAGGGLQREPQALLKLLVLNGHLRLAGLEPFLECSIGEAEEAPMQLAKLWHLTVKRWEHLKWQAAFQTNANLHAHSHSLAVPP